MCMQKMGPSLQKMKNVYEPSKCLSIFYVHFTKGKRSWVRLFIEVIKKSDHCNALLSLFILKNTKSYFDLIVIHCCQYIIATSLFLDLKWQFSGGWE